MEVKITEIEPPLRETMAFEACYPEALQSDSADRRELLDLADVRLWLYANCDLVGECFGLRLSTMMSCYEDPTDPQWIISLEHFERWKAELGIKVVNDEQTIYCYSTTILPKFQSKGWGGMLKKVWLHAAKKAGYKLVMGHSTHEGIFNTNEKLGAKHIERFENWFNSGRIAWLYGIIP